MAENESRNERKKVEETMRSKNNKGLSKVYYWTIGFLFLVLFVLVVYIFAKSGDNVKLGDQEETSSLVQGNEEDSEEDASEDQIDEIEEAEETESAEEEVDEPAEDSDEEKEEEPEEPESNETSVNEDAPLDTTHAVDYNDGSADRIAIKEKVMQVTGLGNDLIEHWIGNNGPGRVTADVYSPDKSEIYRVYLQYGESDWHVTDYERLSSIPGN